MGVRVEHQMNEQHNIYELRIDKCLHGSQCKGVKGQVITKIGGKDLFGEEGSSTLDDFAKAVQKAMRKGKPFDVEFRSIGWLARTVKRLREASLKAQDKAARAAKKKSAKPAAKKAKAKAAAKTSKSKAAPKKAKAPAKKKKPLAPGEKRHRRGKPRRFTINPNKAIELNFVANDAGRPQVRRCYKNSQCPKTCGYVVAELDGKAAPTFDKFERQVLRLMNKGRRFEIVFVRAVDADMPVLVPLNPAASASGAKPKAKPKASAAGKRKRAAPKKAPAKKRKTGPKSSKKSRPTSHRV